MVVPVWYDGPQFSPSIIRKKSELKKKKPVAGYKQTLKILKDFTTSSQKA